MYATFSLVKNSAKKFNPTPALYPLSKYTDSKSRNVYLSYSFSEGERNFWDGRQSVTAKGPSPPKQKPINLKVAPIRDGKENISGGGAYNIPNTYPNISIHASRILSRWFLVIQI